MDGFDACMANQRERARAAANRDAWSTAGSIWVSLSDRLPETEFMGYDHEYLEGAKEIGRAHV